MSVQPGQNDGGKNSWGHVIVEYPKHSSGKRRIRRQSLGNGLCSTSRGPDWAVWYLFQSSRTLTNWARPIETDSCQTSTRVRISPCLVAVRGCIVSLFVLDMARPSVLFDLS